MPRGSWKKRWIKLYVTGWLHGTIRWQLSSEERGVWADFLALAGETQKDGAICDNDGRPLPLDFIASQFNIKRSLLNRFLTIAKSENMITEKNGVLYVTNYQSYQSEYERQKPYRDKARYSAKWDAMSHEDQQIALDTFGPVDTWDLYAWIAATGGLSDSDTTQIEKDTGVPLSQA